MILSENRGSQQWVGSAYGEQNAFESCLFGGMSLSDRHYPSRKILEDYLGKEISKDKLNKPGKCKKPIGRD